MVRPPIKDLTDEQKERIQKIISDAVFHHARANNLTNKQLAETLMNELWAEADIGTREEALLFVAIMRLSNESD